MHQLSTHTYRNEFVQTFDGDQSGNLFPRQTPGVLYSKALPTPVKKPRLLAWSDDLARELGIQKPDANDVNLLGGNFIAPSMQPYAACYAGHQFGNWAGQLGDGRAITLGEWPKADGTTWELQLKGAGRTPYSRRADGRAVLRSSVREYLMSEAMHYLGVPTTRALSLLATGEQVMRDMFYDGHPAYEPGAIVMRAAPSFLRFGNFEILAARNETEHLAQLVDWTISRYYPQVQDEHRILDWFRSVVDRTAFLVTEWLRVGFVHGVMNTDNMSILGLTIDYGPYSFLDDYDPSFTPNTTDLPGRRYAYGRQPSVAYWNLGCLAGALEPLVQDTKALEEALQTFETAYAGYYHTMMGNKLGLDAVREEDKVLIAQFEKTLAALRPDMTIFYQLLMALPQKPETPEAVTEHFRESFYTLPDAEKSAALFELVQAYSRRMEKNTGSREAALERMRNSNPRFILRNYLLHQAIEELEKGKDTLFVQLQAAMRNPYAGDANQFFAKRPDWAGQKAGCSMLSCSS